MTIYKKPVCVLLFTELLFAVFSGGAEAASGQWLRGIYDFREELAQAQMPLTIGVAVALALILIFMTASNIKNRKINKTIAEQAAVLAAIYDSLPVLVFCKDLNGVYTSCNRRFEELSKSGKAGIIGKTFAEAVTYDDKISHEFEDADQKVIDENISLKMEGWYTYPDKSRRPMDIIKTPLIQDGRVTGILGIALDVTERKRAEEAANKAHEQAKIMLDMIPTIGCYLMDSDHKLFDCNREALRLFEINDKQEFINRFYDLSPEYQPCGRKSKEIVRELIAEAWDKGFCHFEWEHQKLNGELIPCEVTLIRVEYNGEVIVAGYVHDMRELIAAAENARETEKRMQIMLDTMPLACRLVSRDYKIIDCNREAVDLFGAADKEECLANNNGFSPEFQPCGRRSRELRHEYLEKAFYKGYLKFEWLHERLGGEPLPCEITLVRVKYGVEYIIASYIRDLREQKAFLEEMRRAEIAEESNNAKSRFLAMMSHEIRTPMNAILGITEIFLQDEALESKYEEAFSRIYRSGDLLLSIINDLLDMSKIDANKLELVLARYEIASLISDVVNLNLVRFSSMPLQFELQADENTPSALIGDELRIKQILNNLLSNSFKYTKKGMVSLSVSAEKRNEEDNSDVTLVFCVSDTGVGMTEEQVAMLFDEYTRFNMEANRLSEGTGLGMNITHGLLNMMNGEITVESEAGRGTTVTVRLPQEDAGAGILGREVVENLQRFREHKGAYIKNAQAMREPMPYGRVFIVDDSDLNLYVAKGLLAPYELVIDTAESGFAAIDMIKSGQQFDIVFMDHMMPEMDGVETVKIMREMGYSSPIVALTADAVSGRAEMFLKSGFDDFLSKPIDIRHLDAVLKKLVRDRHPREVVEAARASRKKKEEAKIAKGEAVSAFLSTVKKIGAINAEIGLSRFSGMEDVYYNTLALFHKTLPKERNAMSDFMNEQDLKNFSIVVHSIKSQLATIGAMGLSSEAQRLEAASKNNEMEYCKTHYPDFNENLLALHTQLSTVLSGEATSSAEKQTGDDAYLREHIKTVLEAADGFDGDTAVESIKQLQVYDYGEEVNTLLDNALAALNDFDFDTVAEILSALPH